MSTVNMIDLSNPVPNKEKKYGAAKTYILGYAKNVDGSISPCLFTAREVAVGIERASKNPEDLPVRIEPVDVYPKKELKKIGFWERFWRLFI